MANAEHLKILRHGVEVWNDWRIEHPDCKPDLSGANLEGLKLCIADLQNANIRDSSLRFTDLSGADLSEADLTFSSFEDSNFTYANLFRAELFQTFLGGANFTNANLSEANLIDACLTRAILDETELTDAKLIRADLSGAVFRDARVRRTDFTDSKTFFTTFADLDLSSAIGLDTVDPHGPSEVGIRTLYKSGGKIPKAFLIACGMPDDFVAYLPSFFTREKAIQFCSCFISYSSKNQDFAERLHVDLKNRRIDCWFAPEELKIGDRFPDRIEESIRLYDKLLLILSRDSIQSSWVEREVRAAFEKETKRDEPVLFPIRVDEAVMSSDKEWAASIRRTRHIGDFREWKNYDAYQKSLERLLQDLQRERVIR